MILLQYDVYNNRSPWSFLWQVGIIVTLLMLTVCGSLCFVSDVYDVIQIVGIIGGVQGAIFDPLIVDFQGFHQQIVDKEKYRPRSNGPKQPVLLSCYHQYYSKGG